MNDQFSPEARIRLEQYLDAVEDVLRKQHQGREERMSVVDELTGQIYDTLERIKLTDQPITLQQMADVLSKLDPPEAYAHKDDDHKPITASPSIQTKTVDTRHLTRWAIPGLIALGFFVLSTLMMLFMAFDLVIHRSNSIAFGSYEFWAATLDIAKDTLAHPLRTDTASTALVYIMYFQPDSQSYPTLRLLIPMVLCLPGLLAPLVTTLCGIITLAKIQQSPRLLSGWRLGVRMSLIFPLLLTYCMLTSVLRTMVNLIYTFLAFNPSQRMHYQFVSQNLFDTGNLLDLFTIFACVVFTALLAIVAVNILNQFKPKLR